MARFLAVTPNPAIDVTYRVDRQQIGQTVRVRDVARRAGGKGLNVARILQTLGHEVVAVAPLGGAAGEWMRRALDRDGIDVVVCAVRGETRTTIAVVDDLVHPSLLAEPGPAHDPVAWNELCERVLQAARPGDWILVAGSFLPGATAADLGMLVTAARRADARILVDTSGPLLVAAARAGVDVVKANADEVRQATGEDELDAGIARLCEHGSTVMVSRGSEGSLLCTADGQRHERPALPGISGNATGAGDASTAGLVAAFADDHDVRTALDWAAVTGAAAVLHPLAGAVERSVVAELARQADIDVSGLLATGSPGAIPGHRRKS